MKTIPMSKLFIYIFVFSMQPFAHAYAEGGGGASKYFSISPAMVFNVTDKGRVRHLQISIQLRLDNPADSGLLQEHKPAIQNALVMLLSGREAKDVRSTQGKQELRAEATKSIRKILKKNTGKPLISAVYFSTFVIQ